MTYVLIGVFCVLFSYTIFLALSLYAWFSLEESPTNTSIEDTAGLSVIIAFKDEAANLPDLVASLKTQVADFSIEFILVNDHSQDQGPCIVKDLLSEDKRFRFLDNPGQKGKKNALAYGIKLARHDYILTTDADCRHGARWAYVMRAAAVQSQANIVVGPVVFSEEKGLFAKMAQWEFASLGWTTAALIGMGRPTMSNGANFLFSKGAYEACGRYEAHNHIASGDDVFLLHAVAKKYPKSVVYAKNPAAIVSTPPPKTLKSFFRQRVRWAGKWGNYTSLFTRLLAAYIFLVNALSITAFVLVAPRPAWSDFLFAYLAFRFAFEYFGMAFFLRYFGRAPNFFPFVLTFALYPFYAVFFGLLGALGVRARWK